MELKRSINTPLTKQQKSIREYLFLLLTHRDLKLFITPEMMRMNKF